MKRPLVLVIINYNDAVTTSRLVKNVESYTSLAKILIVDNGSTDDSFHLLKALESDNGLDLISLLKTDYLPKHKKLTLGGLIGFLKEEGFLGETVSEIDFLYDNTAIALAELYSEWRETGKLNYDDEDSNVWSAITNFSASATARKDLLRRLRSIKNQVPDEDGEREIVELWKESNNWESWDKHLDSLIELLQQE